MVAAAHRRSSWWEALESLRLSVAEDPAQVPGALNRLLSKESCIRPLKSWTLPHAVQRRLTANRWGALAILSGTSLAQVLALLAAPFLARIFSPADFGVFAIVLSVSFTAGSVAALRFEMAIPLARDDRDAHGLLVLGLCALFITGTLGLVSVLSFGGAAASLLNAPDVQPWLLLAPLLSTFLGLILLLSQMAVRQRRYAAIGRRSVLQQVLTISVQLTAGLAHVRPGGLIVGLAAGQAGAVLSLLSGAGLRSEDARAGRVPGRLRFLLKRYRNCPLFLTPSGLANALGQQGPLLLMAFFYSTSVAGLFGLAQRVLLVPISSIGQSVSQVYLGELARMNEGSAKRSRDLFISTSRRLCVISATLTIPIFLCAPALFQFVFGDRWASSGDYGRAIALTLFAQLVVAPVSQTLVMLERQVTQMWWDFGRLILTAAAVALPAAAGQPSIVTAWVLSGSSAFAYLILWMLARRAVDEAVRRAERGSQVQCRDL